MGVYISKADRSQGLRRGTTISDSGQVTFNLDTNTRQRRNESRNIRDQLAGNQVDLDYARLKYKEYLKMANYTIRAYEPMNIWEREVRRLESEREKLLKRQRRN